MYITTKVVSSNPVPGKVYSIQYYVIKFVSDLRHVCGFLLVLQFHSHDIAEILLKVALKHHKINQPTLAKIWQYLWLKL